MVWNNNQKKFPMQVLRCMAKWRTRLVSCRRLGGSMQVGDLVKTCEGDYGIVSGFWNSDVDGTLYVEVYANGGIDSWQHWELEVVCK